MAFFENRLVARIERSAVAKICNNGRKRAYTTSGRLRPVFGWAAPLREFTFTPGIYSLADYEALRAMWMVVNFTPYEGFRFRVFSDYQANLANTTVVSLGGGSYQLYRRHTSNAVNFDQKITKPNSDVVVTDSGGTPLTATVNTTTGVVTGVSGGTPAKWLGTFDVPVTFSDDYFPEEWEAGPGPNTLVISREIRVEELRQ